jgi:hypothetical protein
MRSSGPENDRIWEAIRYLEGEVSPGEAARFEASLADDAAAAEALADAVLLCEAVWACEADEDRRPSVPSTRPQRRRAFGVVAAASAALLLVALLTLVGPQPEPAEPPTAAVVGALPDASVLAVWTTLSAASAASLEDIPSADASLAAPAEPSSVPDWMFAALTADSASITEGMIPGSDMQEEPL